MPQSLTHQQAVSCQHSAEEEGFSLSFSVGQKYPHVEKVPFIILLTAAYLHLYCAALQRRHRQGSPYLRDSYSSPFSWISPWGGGGNGSNGHWARRSLYDSIGMLTMEKISIACLIPFSKIFPRRFFCPPQTDPRQAHSSELPRLVWAPRWAHPGCHTGISLSGWDFFYPDSKGQAVCTDKVNIDVLFEIQNYATN